jgi:WhiB family redox-sensing transcriptional regulator
VSEEWMDQAACRGKDADLFFPEPGESLRPAKQICAGCAARDDCLRFAVREQIFHGIWGGLSPQERRRGRRRRTEDRPVLHGSTGGYQAHRRRGEEPCADCRAANAKYQRVRRWKAS